MPAWVQPSIDHLAKNYLFYVWVFSMFVICAGIARWYGKRQWYEREKVRRKELGLPIASLLSVGGSSEQSFTYSSLFHGGLLGVRHVVGVLVYSLVVSLVATQIPTVGERIYDQKEILSVAYSGMSGPLVMLSQSIVSPIVRHWSHNRLVRAGSTIVACAFWPAAYPVLSSLVGDELYAMTAVLILAMVVLSWGRSYTLGMSDGLKAADPEQTYPLVSLEVVQGTSLDQAWLYERTDSDYRLVTRSGSNHIIPAANVKEIKASDGSLAGHALMHSGWSSRVCAREGRSTRSHHALFGRLLGPT